jgi:hypothetical protein
MAGSHVVILPGSSSPAECSVNYILSIVLALHFLVMLVRFVLGSLFRSEHEAASRVWVCCGHAVML